MIIFDTIPITPREIATIAAGDVTVV